MERVPLVRIAFVMQALGGPYEHFPDKAYYKYCVSSLWELDFMWFNRVWTLYNQLRSRSADIPSQETVDNCQTFQQLIQPRNATLYQNALRFCS